MKEAHIIHEAWGVRLRIRDFDLMFTRSLQETLSENSIYWNQGKREWQVTGEENCIEAIKLLKKYYANIKAVGNDNRFAWLNDVGKWREAFESERTYTYEKEDSSQEKKDSKKRRAKTKTKTKYKYPKSYRFACDILDLDYDCSEKQAKRAYRSKSMQHHPDKKKGSTEKMQQVNAAWEKVKRRLRI